MYRKAKQVLAVGLAGLAAAGSCWAAETQRWQVNMPAGVTEVSQKVYDVHMLILWICTAIGAGVFLVMLYSIFTHRKSRGYKASNFHESTALEIAWTAVPFLILISMAVPATNTLLEIYNTDDPDLDVLITGYQWKWKYEYLMPEGENISFFSTLRTPQSEIRNQEPKGEHYLLEVDEPLVLPIEKKVRFLVTANDVIHSWWVPELAVKRDAIPGFINESWTNILQPGVYRGQCSELCGRDHGFMPIVVRAVEQQEFDEWLATKQGEAAEMAALIEQNFTLPELVERGQQVYARSCVACHGANGEGGIGHALAGSPVVTGGMDGQLDVVLNGVPGTAMQAFGDQLNEVDLAAVVTYTRNAFGNNMGDSVQPIDIYQFRKDQ